MIGNGRHWLDVEGFCQRSVQVACRSSNFVLFLFCFVLFKWDWGCVGCIQNLVANMCVCVRNFWERCS